MTTPASSAPILESSVSSARSGAVISTSDVACSVSSESLIWVYECGFWRLINSPISEKGTYKFIRTLNLKYP